MHSNCVRIYEWHNCLLERNFNSSLVFKRYYAFSSKLDQADRLLAFTWDVYWSNCSQGTNSTDTVVSLFSLIN
jgi:hypothetical protein